VAEADPNPVRPRKFANLVIAVLLGLIGGTGIGFMRESAVASIESMRELEAVTGWPALGTLPRIYALPPGGLGTASEPAEGTRELRARKQLADLGVEVRTSTRATNLTEAGVQIGDEFIPCRVKIWAAGNVASFVGKTLGVPVDRVGRVIVNDDLTIPGHPEVQVIGDLASFSHQTGEPLPGVSPVAMQEGRHAARNILRMIRGEKPKPFRYFDKGSMATIGRHKAVADLKFFHLSGLPAWLTWLFVHIIFLVGFRNRLLVLLQWAWAYLTFDKGARLITRNFQSEHRPPA